MQSILDYLDWRGDLSFAAAPFSEADNLVFSMLTFIDFSPAVSPDPTDAPVRLPEAWEAVRERYPLGQDLGTLIPRGVNDLFEKAAASPRFSPVYVSSFRSVIEEEPAAQFSAVTFLLPDNTVFIAFRGTDDTLLGWEEDFRLSFCAPVRAQILAREYVEEVASVFSGPILLGGHSKGGNLALYAAAFCPPSQRGRIRAAYSNDGPGFMREILESREFRSMEEKFVTFVPQSSVVGMLLGHGENYRVIESSAENGILQHDPFTWSVRGPSFVHLDALSKSGRLHEEALADWLEAISPEDRAAFTATVFELLGASGAKTLGDLNADRLNSAASALRAYGNLSRGEKERFAFFLRKLAEAFFKRMVGTEKKVKSEE